jgi:hypothetical protein
MLRVLHIPKTAGSSLKIAFRDYFGNKFVQDYANHRNPILVPFYAPGEGQMDVVDREGYRAALKQYGAKAISSHGSYERLSWLVPPEDTILFLRDPIQMVVSDYEYDSRFHPNPPLVEWIHQAERRNKISLLTKGLDLKLPFIGIKERYEESLVALNKRFGLNLSPRVVNVNPNKRIFRNPYTLDPEVEKEIARLNSEDVALYKEWSQR